MSEIARKPRSVHPPLSDSEWLALKIEAAQSGRTIGETIADAWIKQANGSAASRTGLSSRAATQKG